MTPKQLRSSLKRLAAGLNFSPRRPPGMAQEPGPNPVPKTISEDEELLLKDLLKPQGDRRFGPTANNVFFERLYEKMAKEGLVAWGHTSPGFSSLGDWWKITEKGIAALEFRKLVMSGNYGVRFTYASKESQKSGINTWKIFVNGQLWGWVHNQEGDVNWIVSEGLHEKGAKLLHDHKSTNSFPDMNLKQIKVWLLRRLGLP